MGPAPDKTRRAGLRLATLGRVVPASAAVKPDAWRRYLALLLGGLRAEAARPLPVPPLTLDELGGVLHGLGPHRASRTTQ
ncbi:hypothetical protein ABZ746_27215 [Streptomyces sp. NPDC020096]